MPTVSIIHFFFALQKAYLEKIGQGSHCKVPNISIAFMSVQMVCLESLAASGTNPAASLGFYAIPLLFTMSGAPRWAYSILEAVK